jgi:hypothetical protein
MQKHRAVRALWTQSVQTDFRTPRDPENLSKTLKNLWFLPKITDFRPYFLPFFDLLGGEILWFSPIPGKMSAFLMLKFRTVSEPCRKGPKKLQNVTFHVLETSEFAHFWMHLISRCAREKTVKILVPWVSRRPKNSKITSVAQKSVNFDPKIDGSAQFCKKLSKNQRFSDKISHTYHAHWW